jgi:hypothetical protein
MFSQAGYIHWEFLFPAKKEKCSETTEIYSTALVLYLNTAFWIFCWGGGRGSKAPRSLDLCNGLRWAINIDRLCISMGSPQNRSGWSGEWKSPKAPLKNQTPTGRTIRCHFTIWQTRNALSGLVSSYNEPPNLLQCLMCFRVSAVVWLFFHCFPHRAAAERRNQPSFKGISVDINMYNR